MKNTNYIYLLFLIFVTQQALAIQSAAVLEPYIFHQVGDYKIPAVGDKGSLSLSGVGAKIGGVFGIVYIGAEGQIGLSKMETDLSPDTINRDTHPLAKTYDAIGGTLGLHLWRLQLYGTYFFDEKLNKIKTVQATATDARHDYTFNYMGEGRKFTAAFNILKGLVIGASYHKGKFKRYRQKYEPETTNNTNTGFVGGDNLVIETTEVYLSWRFGTDDFVTIK